MQWPSGRLANMTQDGTSSSTTALTSWPLAAWIAEYLSSLSLFPPPGTALSLQHFQSLCFAMGGRAEGGPSDSLHTFCTSYCRARLQPLLAEIATLDGRLDPHAPLLPWYGVDDLVGFVDECLYCRQHLTPDELAEFLARVIDTASFGRHHVHSFNALVQHYLPDMLRRQAPLVCQETPHSMDDAISRLLATDTVPLALHDLYAISDTFHCMAQKERGESVAQFRRRLADSLQLQRQHWPASSSASSPLLHRIRFLGLRWGPATHVGDSGEGWAAPPHRVRLLNGLLYGSAQYLHLEYEVVSLGSPEIVHYRQACYQRICFFPVLVQSVLCHTSRMPRDVQEIVGEDPDEAIPYLVLRGLCRIAISMEHRAVNHVLAFSPSSLGGNDSIQTEVHTTREPDFEGSYNDVKVRIALDRAGQRRFGSGDHSAAAAAVTSATRRPVLEALFRNATSYQPISLYLAAFGVCSLDHMKRLVLHTFHDPELRAKAESVLHETWLQLPSVVCAAAAAAAAAATAAPTTPPVCEAARRCGCIHPVQQAAWEFLYHNTDRRALGASTTTAEGQQQQQQQQQPASLYTKIAALLTTYYSHIGSIHPLHPNRPLGLHATWHHKALFLAHQCACLLHVLVGADPLDKHEYGGNKRLGPTGRVLCREWRALLHTHVESVLRKELQHAAQRHTRLDLRAVQLDMTSKLSKQLTCSIRERVGQTGSKNGKEDRNAQASVVQNLDLTNHTAAKSHVRRVDMPVERIGKCETMRDVQASTWNKYCPIESPDSKAGGLVRNLASDVRITTARREWAVVRYLLRHDIRSATSDADTCKHPQSRRRRLFCLSDDPVAVEECFRQGAILVLLNGDPIGVTQDPAACFACLKALKRSPCGFRDLTIVPVTGRGQLGMQLVSSSSTFSDTNDTRFVDTFYRTGDAVYVRHLLVYTDAGRILSPYFVVNQATQQVRFQRQHYAAMRHNPTIDNEYLVCRGLVEYLHTHEENCCGMLADTPHDLLPQHLRMRIDCLKRLTPAQEIVYTHCQLHPAIMNGILANLIPSTHLSTGSRTQFAINMTRQDSNHVSTYAQEQFATYMSLVLPQHPLVRTIGGTVLRETDVGSGLMIHVLALCFHGANIEDGFPVSRQFTEAASSHLVLHRHYHDEISSTQHVQVAFEKPPPTALAAPAQRFDGNALDTDGLPPAGAWLDGCCERRGIVMHKVCTYAATVAASALGHSTAHHPQAQQHVCSRAIPEALRRDEAGRVARVMRASLRGFGHEMAAVQMYDVHKLEAGDKVKFLSGHKMTISFEFAPEDMPYCLDGSPVDGILDPTYCFRMICNQTSEAMANAAALASGTRFSAAAFSGASMQQLAAVLRAHGQSPMLLKRVCDGASGKLLFQAVPYFVVSMQVLRYLSKLCELARSRGPSSTFTHQAVEGRRRGGGIQFSDMDKENMMGHGAARLVHESTSVLGSNCHVPYCRQCCRQALWPAGAVRPVCVHCHSDQHTGFVEQQYASVLFAHYQQAQGVQVLVQTDREKNLVELSLLQKME